MSKTDQDWLWGNLAQARGGAMAGVDDRDISFDIDGESTTMSVGDYLKAVSASGAGRIAAEEKRAAAAAKAKKDNQNMLLYLAAGGAALLLLTR